MQTHQPLIGRKCAAASTCFYDIQTHQTLIGRKCAAASTHYYDMRPINSICVVITEKTINNQALINPMADVSGGSRLTSVLIKPYHSGTARVKAA